jgi:DNA-binding HxlR family transcriptional regulator
MKNHTDEINVEGVRALNGEIRESILSFSGKWKLEILWLLSRRMHRFNALRRAIPGITQNMLTAQLRELERDGMVARTVYPEIPPRVEYVITDRAKGLAPVFREIFAWSRNGTGHSDDPTQAC